MKIRKRYDLRRVIWFGVLITLIFSIGFTVARLIFADHDTAARSDYTLMLTQCVLGIAVLFVPDLIQRRF
ncbi:MAG: hypothetical protein IJN42_02925, partial [Clostridia bacterium]|nr:hypothetical protein [Clostridia bacterium]